MLIITGSLAYDYIMGFPGSFSDHILPEHIHNINLSFIVDNFAKRRGGTAGNVSYTLGLLQTPHTLFSYAGKDFEEYRAEIEKIGIKTDGVVIDIDDYTATGFAMTDNSQNQIWGFYYGAAENNPKLQLKKVAKKNDLVYIGPQGAEGSLSLVRQCIDLGIPYMFDPGFILTQVNDTELELGCSHARYITVNEYEGHLIQSRLKNWGKIAPGKIVITTLGENGARIETDHQVYTIAPAKPDKIGTTTGAGDAWRGGFLAGIARGYDLQISGQMGAVTASFAVEQLGTQDQEYSKKVFAKRYKDTYNEEIKI